MRFYHSTCNPLIFGLHRRKRGYYGVFHHFTWKHLQRYLDEFEVRWNMAGMAGQERVDWILESAFGERLTYKELTQ